MAPPNSDRKRPFEADGAGDDPSPVPLSSGGGGLFFIDRVGASGGATPTSTEQRAKVERSALPDGACVKSEQCAKTERAETGVKWEGESKWPAERTRHDDRSDRKRPFSLAADGVGDETLPVSPPSSSSSAAAMLLQRHAKVARSTSSKLVSGKKQTVIDLLDDDDGESSDDEVQFVKETKPRKSVHFSEIEHEVFYFKRFPVENSPPSLAAVDENEQASVGSSGIHPSSEHSRATADYTVISSNHGRARRQLRSISKHDLKAAVKYGRKLPSHPNPRTGEPRWKFVHNGLVYITDATCTHEITSYKEDIVIEPYRLTMQQMEHHTELKRILEEEPYLCTGHTYIVIDQSGSMRESDVGGFKSRSHAAYGTLSLEFIAEQLSQRPNQDDLFAESVTVIEMQDEGSAVFERVPFDWILFNRLLKRPNIARPCFHGNYNESLTMVSKMISKEHNNLLEDGADPGELPNFSLVFLSDGRPSDSTKAASTKRCEILESLASSLGKKFHIYCMGIGGREAEFEVLQSMVNTVTANGGNGQFVHAGLSTVKLSQTFSQISSTLTSHRTTLLGDCDEAGPGKPSGTAKATKDFTMRETGKIVGKRFPSEKFCIGKSHAITRFRFDKAMFEKGLDPWKKEVGLATHGADGVEIETKPFGKGSERLAYRFHEIKRDRSGFKRVGKMMVAKNSVHLNENETKEEFHLGFCRVQSIAADLAEKFNQAVKRCPQLKSISGETRPPELSFMMCRVYTIKNNQTGERSDYLVERMLQGKFTKYNSNNGFVKGAQTGVHNTRTIELVAGRVQLEDFVQAYSHWVYEHTEHKMIVVDLQGVLNEEGRYPEFQLTDPAICTRKGQRYGKTDMRLNGIRKFCTTHRCGPVCSGLGLPYMNKSESSFRSVDEYGRDRNLYK